MNFLKAFVSWKVWLGIILGLAALVALWFLTFDYLGKYTKHGVEIEVPDLSQMTVQQAMETLDDQNLSYEIDSIKFTEAHPPFAILDFYPAAGSKVKPGRRIFIKSNPSTWQPVEVPNLKDKSKRLAITQLTMKGFMLGDTIYVKDPARDAVLAMMYKGDTIEKGVKLPRGSKVDLILGRGLNFDMPVPNLMNLSLASAKQLIRDKFFDVGQIYFMDEVQDSLNSVVVYQDPPSSDTYDEGLPISIWLSTRDRSSLRKKIDSLDVIYRRRMKEEDSVFYRSVQRSQDIDIKDLPEEIRNQVKYDQQVNKEMQTQKPKKKKTSTATIDTTGISID